VRGARAPVRQALADLWDALGHEPFDPKTTDRVFRIGAVDAADRGGGLGLIARLERTRRVVLEVAPSIGQRDRCSTARIGRAHADRTVSRHDVARSVSSRSHLLDILRLPRRR
jgi:hypothetical protein